MPRPDDLDALVARAQDGDVRAFEALVAGHLAEVRRFAHAFAASEADADDLAQEALLKVHRSLRLFRYQSAFSSWLYAVVRNAFLDFAKSRAGRARAAEVSLAPPHADRPSDGPAADELLAGEEERRRVWRALREVPLEFRTAVVLFDVEGHSYDEVAAIEGIAIGTVKSRLARGRAHLRRLLVALDAAEAPRGPRASPLATGTRGGPSSSHLGRSGS